MAEYHMNLGVISRSGGKSTTAHSAYIACTKLEEERTSLVFDYSNKKGLLYEGTMAPDECPDWVYDKQLLENAVEAFEDHIAQTRFRGHNDPEKNAKSLAAKEKFLESCATGYTANFALPLEIENPEDLLDLSQRIIKSCYVQNELIVRYAIHGDKGNPHLHILSTTRPWVEDTFSKSRFRINREKVIEIRHQAAEIANEFAQEKGYNYVLDARSYEDRGLNIIPTRHLGPNAHHKLQDGSRISHENNKIHQDNIRLLFKSPEELVNLVAARKVVFTEVDIEREVFKRVGGDMYLYSLLKTRLLESELLKTPLMNAQLETREVLPHMFNISNDNVGLSGEELKVDFDETVRSYTHHLFCYESIVGLGKNLKDEAVFTTQKAIELEKNAKDVVQHLCLSKGKEISSEIKQDAIINAEHQNKFDFSEEQKQAIDYLLEPHQLRVLKGNAGTGKTTILKPMVDAYKEAGYVPLGVAFQGKVSELLGHDLNITAYTLDQLGKRWKKYDTLKEMLPTLKGESLRVAHKELEKLAAFQLNERHVVVLDEGNMVEGHHWQELLIRVQKAGAHLKVVQDNKQIKALFGADISRLVENSAGHFELTEVHRQKEPWMRAASAHLNSHDVIEGLKPYDEHGCLTFKESVESTRYALAEAYVNNLRLHPEEFHVALSFQNQDVEDLNGAIRHQLKQRGSLGASLTFKGKEFSVGDRIVFTENDHTGWFIKTIDSPIQKGSSSLPKKGVKNGTFGQIQSLDEKKAILDVRLLKDDRLVRVNLKTYDAVEYGYGMTVNKAEGQTFDWTYGLFDRLMNANKTLIWMTRHRFGFQGFIAKDQASIINDMAAAVGRSDYRPLISDFNTQGCLEAELVREYLKTAYEAGNLWGTISKENPDAPFDHSEWTDFQAAQHERNQFAEEILGKWDLCQTFANQVGIKKITLEVQAGLREKPLNEVEVEALQRVETYRAVASQARTLWDQLSKTEKLSKTSALLKGYEEITETRNQLAYEIVSFPEIHRPFFKTIKKEEAYVSYGGDVYDKVPPSLKAAEKHAQAYIKAQHQKAFSEKLTPVERGVFNELLAFKKQALDCGRFAAALKNEEALIKKKGDSPLKTALEASSKERDFLAFKVVKFYDKYSSLLERADVSQEQLLKHAVFGEVRQLALKHSLAKTIEKRLEFADQLRRMVGEGDKLDKPLYGISKSMGVDLSRLRFEQGCLELMKQKGHLPFNTVEELSSAFVSLTEYRVVHQEAAKKWQIIKTHAVEKVTALQDDQIVSLNAWTKNASHEGKEGQAINAENKLLSREVLEKAGQLENTQKPKRKKAPQNLQEKDNAILKEAANTQTLSLVTRELAKVVNGYTSLSSENLPSPSLPQDIQARHVELIHLQSHLRKGHSGYLGIFKMDHVKDKTWESLREKKLSLAGPILEKYGEIIKVSFGHDYGRMQKEAYEHQMGELVSHYQEVRGGDKALLAADLLSHLEKEGYQEICIKTQLKTRDVNFEALHLYGLFHEVSSHLQEKSMTLPVLEKYIQTQEAFSSLWKPRCEVIEKALGPVKEEFAMHREKVLSFLEDKKPNRSCVFALDKLVNETHALISKSKLEKNKDNPGQIPYAPEQNLQTKVQGKLQHLGVSLGVSFSQENLETLSHEIINLSHKKEQIQGQRLALMKRTKFESDAEFFECARNRNETASHLLETPLGKIIEESKHLFLVKDYAERYRSKLEKAPPSSGPSHQIDQKFILQNTQPFIEADVVKAVLIENIASFADDIFSSLGEKHNQAASTAVERRYGNNGKISVNLRTGAWLDWRDTSIAGGPFEMLTKLKGFSFKEAVEYGASWAGIIPERGDLKSLKRLPQKYSSQESEQKKLQKEAEESKVKIERAKTLWEKGQPIQGTLAERYLKEHRNIEESMPNDLQFLPRFRDPTSGKSYPGLMAAARSSIGEVTAVQITCLDPQTAAKADLSVTKRSFGILKGSTVTLQEEKSSNVLFVAEGVETALSLKEAGLKGTIKATLGLSNIKRLTPENLLNGNPNTQIIVCADHDTTDSPATRSLQKAVLDLQSKGFSVTVVKPDKLNEDFNDVLKTKGREGVREILQRNLPKEITKDLLIPAPSLHSKGPPKSKWEEGESGVKAQGKSFAEIEKRCVRYLCDYLEKENRPLTPELKERIVLQSEKAADFMFHAHALKGTSLTEEQTRPYLLRAKYELDRIPEIRRDIIKDWQREDNFNEKTDGLFAHMIAERQASIEGRLYFEAKQKGQNPPSRIEDIAERELKENGEQTKELTEKLSQKYGLSESAATLCAKNVLRYKETHGEKPTSGQIESMVQISREIEKRDYAHSSKGLGSHEIEFLRRRIGDFLFRNTSFDKKFPAVPEIQQAQTHAKTSLEAATSTITHELSKMNQREISL